MDISFEFFPPNSSEAEKKLWSSIKLLEPLNPKFVSVTYGAGGSTRERTHECVSKILRETSLIASKTDVYGFLNLLCFPCVGEGNFKILSNEPIKKTLSLNCGTP